MKKNELNLRTILLCMSFLTTSAVFHTSCDAEEPMALDKLQTTYVEEIGFDRNAVQSVTTTTLYTLDYDGPNDRVYFGNDGKEYVDVDGNTYLHGTQNPTLTREEQKVESPELVSRGSGKAIKFNVGRIPYKEKQRSEIALMRGSDPLPVINGDVYIYKFDIYFEKFEKPDGDYINLHQVKQAGTGSGPFIQFGFYKQGANRSDLEFKVKGGGDPKKLLAYADLKLGTWYKVTIKWKYSPDSNDGFASCRLNGGGRNITVRFDNQKIGSGNGEDKIEQVSHGIYKKGDMKRRIIRVDNVIFKRTR